MDLTERLKAALADRYRIERELGRGGMAIVFLADDLKHDRRVAIKVLSPELTVSLGPERFLEEIRITARLTHPHILPLLDSGAGDGLLYSVTPYVAGESLHSLLGREKQLPIEDAVRIAREVAEALDYAHEEGIVHRDVKPENILLASGHVMLADFGIARAMDRAATRSRLTGTGFSIGTPLYMSPEQHMGAGEVDGRSDIYALGCVLYEMLAGQPPFTGANAESVVHQHLSVEPRPVTALRPAVRAGIAEALRRALAKAPADRFANAGRFAEALANWEREREATPVTAERGAGPRKAMLAVLPLRNLSADPEQEYFNDGMTEELISWLGRMAPRRLGVIARTSAMRYKDTSKSIDEIGRELGVGFVLEGSVRRAGPRVRITAQLIDVGDQSQLWSQTYERDLADVFALQSDVASRIGDALALELLPPPNGAGETAPPTAAFEDYLKGRFWANKRTPEGLARAITHFQRALEEAPRFARAHAGLADCHRLQATYGMLPSGEAMAAARTAALRAIELEESLAEAHTSLAAVRMDWEWAWDEAEREFRRAIDLDPGYATAHHWYAMLLVCTGRFDEAAEQFGRARELEPLSAGIVLSCGELHYYRGDYERALALHRQARELDPGYHRVTFSIGRTLVLQGRHEAGIAELRNAESLGLPRADVLGELGYAYARAGRTSDARRVLAELDDLARSGFTPPGDFALVHVGLGENEEALAWLERALEERDTWVLDLKVEPRFAPLRPDPRFRSLVERLGLGA